MDERSQVLMATILEHESGKLDCEVVDSKGGHIWNTKGLKGDHDQA